MEEQWHIIRGEDQTGPFSTDQLKEQLGALDLDAERILVWHEGMEDWVEPRTVPGLLDRAPSPASPAAPAPAAAPEPAAAAPESATETAAAPAGPDLSHLNPYETPASALATPAPAPASTEDSAPVEGGNHPLEVGTCINTGWKLTTSNFGKLILFGLAYIGLILVLVAPLGALEATMGIDQEGGGSPTATQILVSVFSQLVQNVVSIFLGIGAALFGLGMIKQTNPKLGLLFAGGPHFISVFAASILYGLAVLVGIILLIIPGIYLALRLSQYQFAIVDQKLGPIDGLKASWAMTKGNLLSLILLGLATFGIVLLGMLALGVGLLWAYPTVLLAAVAAYQNMVRGPGALPQLS